MQVHNDARFRQLSAPNPSAQFLWLRLLTSPESVAAPGVIPLTRAGLAEKLGWKLKDLMSCFDELTVETDEHDYPLVMADWAAGLVFLPKAVEYNPPVSPNAVKAWVASLLRVPECDLRDRVIKRLEQFLSPYSEQFQEPFVEQFRYPGAGAGTGAGHSPKSPLSRDVPRSGAALDGGPPPPRGGADEPPSAQPSDTTRGGGQGGETESGDEWDLDLDDDSDGGSEPPSTAVPAGTAEDDQWALESPTVPLDGKKGVRDGCTICAARVKGSRVKPRAPGLLFRTVGGRRYAAMCWACIKIGCLNEFALPTPGEPQQSTAFWKCFEHAMPEHVRAPKKTRDQIVADAVAATRQRMESKGHGAEVAARVADQKARDDAPDCAGCEGKPNKPGLVYGLSADGKWLAALCTTCGGSIMHREPPAFMGPPIPQATVNGKWGPIAKTDAPTGDDEARFKWIQSAITATRDLVKAGHTIAGTTSSAAKTSKPAPEPGTVPAAEPPTPEDPEADEFALDDPEPPETGIASPVTAGDDEFSLDDDVPL